MFIVYFLISQAIFEKRTNIRGMEAVITVILWYVHNCKITSVTCNLLTTQVINDRLKLQFVYLWKGLSFLIHLLAFFVLKGHYSNHFSSLLFVFDFFNYTNQILIWATVCFSSLEAWLLVIMDAKRNQSLQKPLFYRTIID